MKTHPATWLLALALAGPAWTAERLRREAGPESLEHFNKNRAARVLHWEHPQYPPEPGAEWVEQAVRLAFEVDAAGRVTDLRVLGGAEKFQEAALAAVARWTFEPEIVDGEPAAMSKEVRVVFTPRGTPRKTSHDEFHCPYQVEYPPATPPGEPADTSARYPAGLMPRRLSGEVELVLGIDREGKVAGVEILRASHPEFLSAALQTVADWQMRPARRGRVPQTGRKRAVLTFHPVDEEGRLTRHEWLERNGIFLRSPPGAKSTTYFDHTPEALSMVDPVHPHPLATDAKGSARVNFTVNHEGRVIQVSVDEATAPEFGEAVAAAIAAWQFEPLRREGKETWADFSLSWRFVAPRPDSAEQRLLADGQAGRKPVNPRELDRPLFPLFVAQPVYPLGRRETGEEGEALVEIIIDREGRVRLPRVRSASHPDFGWAAATAVSRWLFETPRQAGEPVDVQVAIPLKFTARAAGE